MQYPFFRLDNRDVKTLDVTTAYKFIAENRYDRIVYRKFVSGHIWYSYEKHFDTEVNPAYHYETFAPINEETYNEIVQDFMNWQANN
jgi:hypothetical protein